MRLEQALPQQIDQAQDRDARAVAAQSQAQPREGDHRRHQLQAHGFHAVAQAAADRQVLLEPAKQQLNGLITNDKFCLVRTARLVLTW
ncbi:hypothetical protein DK412_21010 [Methylobacterium sp. 17Sr1-1]|nr:hypothetical protein DK412_21010 [Methylobacterium sp. 17Sr1-1]